MAAAAGCMDARPHRLHSRATSAGAPAMDTRIDQDAIARYRRDGFLIIPELFNAAEVEVLRNELAGDFIGGIAHDTHDGSGRAARFAIWYEIRDDVWGAASICPRVVDTLRALMGEEIAF